MSAGIDLSAIFLLADTKENRLRELAKLIGFDPRSFYIGTNLAGVDIRGQDLRGMRFDGTDLSCAILDRSTQFDPDIEDELNKIVRKRYLEISEDIFFFVDNFYNKKKFPSRGWFIKKIIPCAGRAIARNRAGWRQVIDQSPELRNFFASARRRRIELIIPDLDYREGESVSSEYGGRGGALTALILVGILCLAGYDPSNCSLPISRQDITKFFTSSEENKRIYL